jgi:hypothetical protein
VVPVGGGDVVVDFGEDDGELPVGGGDVVVDVGGGGDVVVPVGGGDVVSELDDDGGGVVELDLKVTLQACTIPAASLYKAKATGFEAVPPKLATTEGT